MPSPEFNFDTLNEVTGGDPTFEREILEEFLELVDKLIAQQQACLGSADAYGLERAAHSLKGSSSTIGATRLGELGKEIEEFAHDQQLPRAVAKLEQALQEFAALKPVLEQHIKRLAA
jgi:histidine phosphotransfer protein HptB